MFGKGFVLYSVCLCNYMIQLFCTNLWVRFDDTENGGMLGKFVRFANLLLHKLSRFTNIKKWQNVDEGFPHKRRLCSCGVT